MSKYEVTQPTVVNIICPRCKKSWMNKNGEDKFYFCYACSYVLFERQIKQLETFRDICYNKIDTMKRKVRDFINNPWVAFPLMFLSLVIFMWLGLSIAR